MTMRVAVIGGGVIGVEFASVWKSFGADVTVVEGLPHLVPAEDEARIDPASFKSRLNDCDTIKDIEGLLRDAAGLSRSNATAIVAKLRAILQRDADEKGEEKDELAALAAFIRSHSL